MMKSFIFSLLGLAISGSLLAQSPITLTAGTIPAGNIAFSEGLASISNVPSPLRGINMTWDYSNLAIAAIWPITYVPASVSQSPEANFVDIDYTDFFPDYECRCDKLLAYNSMYFGQVAIHALTRYYTMQQTTGVSTDVLTIPNQVAVLSSPARKLVFPATYNSVWTNTYEFSLQAQIDVSSLGLNSAPMEKRSFVTSQDSVIGWGTLQVPVQSGPSMPYPVLMVKHTSITIDSMYLNWAPASQALLDIFGITQGHVTSNNSYRFFRNGSVKPLAEFQYGANPFNTLTRIFLDRSLSVLPLDFANALPTVAIKLYPNPTTGNELHIECTKTTSGTWAFALTDLTGREILRKQIFSDGPEVQQTINLPANTANGMYLWQLTDENGNLKSTGKMSIAR